MVCRFLATFTAVLRIATALAVSVALLVPHISNAPRYDMAMAMMQAEGTMAERSHPGKSHGTFGGAVCAVVCLGAPVIDSRTRFATCKSCCAWRGVFPMQRVRKDRVELFQ